MAWKFLIFLLCVRGAQSLSFHNEKVSVSVGGDTDLPFIPLPVYSIVGGVQGTGESYEMTYTSFGIWVLNIGTREDNKAYELADTGGGAKIAHAQAA